MISEITKKVEALNKLKETAHNPKILIEEMRLVADKAFQLQEDILALIQQAQEQEENIATIQSLFETREMVWDMMDDITSRELEIKEKTNQKGTCHHQKDGCCCGSKDHDCHQKDDDAHTDDTHTCSNKKCCCHKH